MKQWHYRGEHRPPFAEEPGKDQESVWDYPRPPSMRLDPRPVRVETSHREPLALTNGAFRIAETAAPPTFYVPVEDVVLSRLIRAPGTSFCEWKGTAHYWALMSAPNTVIAWDYAEPNPAYAEIKDCLGFYPGRVRCFVDGERVRAQPGAFYGGWITSELVGPFKGMPGTEDW
jgi:uncharacterized protein (DUF427 family)